MLAPHQTFEETKPCQSRVFSDDCRPTARLARRLAAQICLVTQVLMARTNARPLTTRARPVRRVAFQAALYSKA